MDKSRVDESTRFSLRPVLHCLSHEFMSREGMVAGGGVLTQVIGWEAGGGRMGGRRG